MQKQQGQDPAIFTLKEGHIKLIENLNFKVCAETEYGDRYIPGIDRKRPFGNDGAILDVLRILGYRYNEYDEFHEEDVNEAEELLIELPLALEVVVKNKTFTPGNYEVRPYGAYFEYRIMKNYKEVHTALDEIEWTLCQTKEDREKFAQLQMICMNNFEDDPWDVMQAVLGCKGRGVFWDGVIQIFEKHHAQARRDARRETGVQAGGQ